MDWKAVSIIGAPLSYVLYVFIGTNSGNPTIDGPNQVWTSGNISGITSFATTTPIDIKSKIPTAGTYYIKIAAYVNCQTGVDCAATAGFDNVIVNWSKIVVSYASDKPTTTPVASLGMLKTISWNTFEETATKNGGEIYYQLSPDNGTNWWYYNGTAWATTTSIINYNTATDVNSNISKFTTSTNQIKWRAYLSGSGSQQVILDNVRITYTQNQRPQVQALAPAQNTTYGYVHVNYNLQDTENDVSSLTAYEYSLNGTFTDAVTMIASTTDPAHSGVSGLTASAGGTPHVFVWDARAQLGNVVTTTYENITGFSNAEVLGQKAGNSKLWGGLMDKAFYEKMWHIIKVEKKPFAGEINNKRKNGEPYVAFASITPILNQQGGVEFFVALERDITKEKQIDKAKTEFVSLASHQLRTPLSAINWYAEMLLAGDAGKLNTEQDKYVKEIYSGNQRMVMLVNALLNVSRIELGTFAVEPQPTDFVALANSVISEVQPQIKEKKLNFNFAYDKNLPLIDADPKLIRIIIQNFLTNAIKYTPAGGRVSVKLAKQGSNVEISVADTGYGIPEAAKPKIFEKLYRAGNVREKETEGTGLGLYIVKNIVDEAKGKVWFESAENKGSTFHVSLPLKGMKKKVGSKELTPN